MKHEIFIPDMIITGGGSRFKTGEIAKELNLEKLLLISDKYIDQLGMVDEILESLNSSGIKTEKYTGVNPDPTVGNVDEALEILKSKECQGIVTIGGGSSIDTAKAVAVMAANPGCIGDYMGYNKVPNPGIPLITIPTTAGTGSEVTRVTIIADPEKNLKMMCLDKAFMPKVAIVDYELTIGMGKGLTAAVGVDALTHAIEAYVSKKANSVTDMFALSAIRSIYKNLFRAYNNPKDESAREAVMFGSMQAGIAFSNSSVCTVHGMSRPIGANFHIPHGLSNAMLLPLVTENSITGDIKRYAQIAVEMELCGNDTSDEEAFTLLVDELKELNRSMDIPNMKEYGVDYEEYKTVIDSMVNAAIDSGSPGNNPRVFTHDEMAELYVKAYDYR